MEKQYYIISEQTKNSIIIHESKVRLKLELLNETEFVVEKEHFDIINSRHELHSIPEENVVAFEGILNLIEENVDCINISFGYNINENTRDITFQKIINLAKVRNIVTIVATGNSGPNPNSFQSLAELDSVISVGATNKEMVLQSISSVGQPGKSYNLFVADGIIDKESRKRIDSVLGPNSKKYNQGTSFSAPRVSAIVCGIKILHHFLEALLTHAIKYKEAIFEINFGVIGLPDDSAYLPFEFNTLEVQKKIKENKLRFESSTKEQEHKWLKLIGGYIAGKDGKIDVKYTFEKLMKILVDISCPLENYSKEQVGFGFLSFDACLDFLYRLSPISFIKYFSTLDIDKLPQKELESFDKDLGRLFSDERINYVFKNCFINQIMKPIKIIDNS